MADNSRTPPAFAERPHSQIFFLAPREVRKLRKCNAAAYNAILFFFSAIASVFMYWPIALIFLLVDIYYWAKLFRIIKESRSKTVRQARCPNCEKLVNFWISAGFPCPFCRHMLMQHVDQLYDIAAEFISKEPKTQPSGNDLIAEPIPVTTSTANTQPVRAKKLRISYISLAVVVGLILIVIAIGHSGIQPTDNTKTATSSSTAPNIPTPQTVNGVVGATPLPTAQPMESAALDKANAHPQSAMQNTMPASIPSSPTTDTNASVQNVCGRIDPYKFVFTSISYGYPSGTGCTTQGTPFWASLDVDKNGRGVTLAYLIPWMSVAEAQKNSVSLPSASPSVLDHGEYYTSCAEITDTFGQYATLIPMQPYGVGDTQDYFSQSQSEVISKVEEVCNSIAQNEKDVGLVAATNLQTRKELESMQ